MTTKFIRNVVKKSKLNEHVTLAEAKYQLRIEDDFYDDDTYISGLISDAQDIAEKYCSIDIADTENIAEFYNITSSSIRFTEVPFSSITSIQYKDDTGTLHDITTEYIVEDRSSYFTIHFNDNIQYSNLIVTFKSGYSTGNCPKNIKRAILVKISDLFDTERAGFSYSGVNRIETFERLLAGSLIERF